MANGRIQNEDIKSAAELVAAGGTAAQLPNDTKVYVTANSYNKTLAQAIIDGDLGGSGLDSSFDIKNLGLSVTASAGTITVAVVSKAGTTPTASDQCKVPFRSGTATNGTYNTRSITAANTLSLSGAQTLGVTSGVAAPVTLYLFDNAGTLTLGASLGVFDEGSLQSSSTTATSAGVIYQPSALASKPVRILGRFVAVNTAGSWASPTEVSVAPFLKGGVTDGSSALQGQVGELISVNKTSNTNGSTTANTYTDVQSITLTPGDWDITAIGTTYCEGATGTGIQGALMHFVLTDNSNNILKGQYSSFGNAASPTMLGSATLYHRVTITATTTYKTRIGWQINSGSPTLTTFKEYAGPNNQTTIDARRAR